MTTVGTMRRTQRGATVIAAVALALTLAACTPDPAPSPSSTGFASEEEAFAAAEATYRAYSDALNARRSDPNSEPDPDSFLTGEALAGSIQGAQRLHDAGVHLEGPSLIVRVTPVDATSTSATISVCIDSSGSRVIDAQGIDVTPAERVAINELTIEVIRAEPQSLILSSELADGAECS